MSNQPQSELDVFMQAYAERNKRLNKILAKFNTLSLKFKKED